jgi:maleate isomerase
MQVPGAAFQTRRLYIGQPKLDSDQAFTNVSMVRLAAEAEGWLGKPVIAIHTATLWHAYRANGFTGKLYGVGSLLSEH